MKYIFVFCFLLLSQKAFTQEIDILQHSNGLLRFIARHETIRDFALSSLIDLRCDRYAQGFEVDCERAVDEMIDILDYDILWAKENTPVYLDTDVPESFVFVAFKKNLIDLLTDPSSTHYLRSIREKLSVYLSTRKDSDLVNLWDFSLSYYNSEIKAAKAIAAFFQDTSKMKLHLAYLEKARIRGKRSFETNRELLSQVLGTISLVLDYEGENFGKIFYPTNSSSQLNSSIYHYYVPVYLAQALKEQGHEAKVAMTASWMLTLTYEFMTDAPDYRYVWKDPKSITDEWKLRDIFGGYSGSMFGAKLSQRANAFEQMKHDFKSSTTDAVQNLLR